MVHPLFAQWRATIDKAALRMDVLTAEELARGESLAPPPEAAVESIWAVLVAFDVVADARFGKVVACVGCAATIGLGYALPTVQLALAQRRIREAEQRRRAKVERTSEAAS